MIELTVGGLAAMILGLLIMVPRNLYPISLIVGLLLLFCGGVVFTFDFVMRVYGGY